MCNLYYIRICSIYSITRISLGYERRFHHTYLYLTIEKVSSSRERERERERGGDGEKREAFFLLLTVLYLSRTSISRWLAGSRMSLVPSMINVINESTNLLSAARAASPMYPM